MNFYELFNNTTHNYIINIFIEFFYRIFIEFISEKSLKFLNNKILSICFYKRRKS